MQNESNAKAPAKSSEPIASTSKVEVKTGAGRGRKRAAETQPAAVPPEKSAKVLKPEKSVEEVKPAPKPVAAKVSPKSAKIVKKIGKKKIFFK